MKATGQKLKLKNRFTIIQVVILSVFQLFSFRPAIAQTAMSLCVAQNFNARIDSIRAQTGHEVSWIDRSQIMQEYLAHCRTCMRTGSLESCARQRVESKPVTRQPIPNESDTLSTLCLKRLLSGETTMNINAKPQDRLEYIKKGAYIFLGMDWILTYYKLTTSPLENTALGKAVMAADRDELHDHEIVSTTYPIFVGYGAGMCRTLALRCSSNSEATGCKEFLHLLKEEEEEPGICLASARSTQPEPPPPLPELSMAKVNPPSRYTLSFKPICADRTLKPDLDALERDNKPKLKLHSHDLATALFNQGDEIMAQRVGDRYEGKIAFPTVNPRARGLLRHSCEGFFTAIRLICADGFKERMKIIFNSCNSCEVLQSGKELRCLQGYHEHEDEPDSNAWQILRDEYDRVKDAEGPKEKTVELSRQVVLAICLRDNLNPEDDIIKAHNQLVKAYSDCNQLIGEARAFCNLPQILNSEDNDVCDSWDDLFNVPGPAQGFVVNGLMGDIGTVLPGPEFSIVHADGRWTKMDGSEVSDHMDLGELIAPDEYCH